MYKHSFLAAAIFLTSGILCCLSVSAQSMDGVASNGSQGNLYSNGTTNYQAGQSPVGNPGEAARGRTYSTGTQMLPNLPPLGTRGAAPGSPGPTFGLNGTGYAPGTLPPTTLDSFVYNSGYDDSIYGNEGSYGPPPYMDFGTIGSGMGSYGGLTTGHSSGSLPSSWGYTSGTY